MTYNKKIDELVAIISKDKENPSTRLSLAQTLGITDRSCRELRREAFLLGHNIVSFSDADMGGSYLSNNPKEVLRFGREAKSRADKLMEIYRASMINAKVMQRKIDELV